MNFANSSALEVEGHESYVLASSHRFNYHLALGSTSTVALHTITMLNFDVEEDREEVRGSEREEEEEEKHTEK